MKPQVMFLDATQDVGTPLYDEVLRGQRRLARFERWLMCAAALTSLAFIAITFWLRAS